MGKGVLDRHETAKETAKKERRKEGRAKREQYISNIFEIKDNASLAQSKWEVERNKSTS